MEQRHDVLELPDALDGHEAEVLVSAPMRDVEMWERDIPARATEAATSCDVASELGGTMGT